VTTIRVFNKSHLWTAKLENYKSGDSGTAKKRKSSIRAKRVRKQKTDRQDAQLILKLMLKDDFPEIWVPGWENRDLRQLLWHRHRMVPARTRIMNQL
jgi:transposase